jgi:hypothetical protein
MTIDYRLSRLIEIAEGELARTGGDEMPEETAYALARGVFGQVEGASEVYGICSELESNFRRSRELWDALIQEVRDRQARLRQIGQEES